MSIHHEVNDLFTKSTQFFTVSYVYSIASQLSCQKKILDDTK